MTQHTLYLCRMTLHINTRIAEWIRNGLGRGTPTQQGCPKAGDAEPIRPEGKSLRELDEGASG